MNKTILLVFVALAITACKKKIEIPTDAHVHFEHLISAYSSGIISKADKINIIFKDSVLQDGWTEESIRACLDITPRFDYSLDVENNQYLYITPDEQLISGERFLIEVDMEKLTGRDLEKKIFPLVFETKYQDYTVTNLHTEIQDIRKPNLVKIVGNLETTDISRLEDVNKMITDIEKVGTSNIRWSKVNNTTFQFECLNVNKEEKEQRLELSFNGKSIGIKRKQQMTVVVPAQGDFKLLEWEYISHPDQKLELTFTDPINKKQDLEGLIEVEHFDKLTYSVDGSLVTVYLNASYAGASKLTAHKGITNVFGNQLKEKQILDVTIGEPLPTVELIGDGTILPNSQGLIVPFRTIGLKKVDVHVFRIKEDNILQFLQVNEIEAKSEFRRVAERIKEHTIDLEKENKDELKKWLTHGLNLRDIISPEPGAIYRVRFSFKEEYTFCECEDDIDASYYSDNYDYYENSSIDSRDRENKCERQFYYRSTQSKNLLATDIGLIAKKAVNDQYTIVSTNLVNGGPAPSTEIKFYNFQQSLIGRGKTAGDGTLTITLEEEPYVVVANSGRQRSYLKISSGNSQSLSKFNTNGVIRNNGIDAFFYGERGVWRPGDSVFLSFVVKDEFGLLKDGMPMKFTLTDPQGRIANTQSLKLTTKGIHRIQFTTDGDAPTGNYRATVEAGSRSFAKTLKIETVRPNRLKIHFKSKEDLIVGDVNQKFNLSSEWLHGATAGNLNANVSMVLAPTYTEFENYSKYNFHNVSKHFDQTENVIFSGKLDETGKVEFDLKPKAYKSSGKLKASFVTKVFEKGGGFSIDNWTTTYHPYSTYVGMQLPLTNYGQLNTNKSNKINVVTVSPDGKLKTEKTSLQVRVYKIKWRWWWQHNERDIAGYINSSSYNMVIDTTVITSGGKSSFNLRVDEMDWGQYFIQVADGDKHSSGQVVFVDYPNSYRSKQEQNNALLLNMTTDKDKYETNETAQISFPSSGDGKALISIENDIEVVRTYWIDTKEGTTTFPVQLNKSMSPNCYAHITVLQKHIHKKNDKPLRMYGVVSLNVFDKKSVLNPVITMKDEIRPETTSSVTVSEKNGKGMYYTVAVVDEGLLDLTRFKTPRIWEHFNQKRALGITTYDLYDDVINSFSGKFDNVYSIGGDEEGTGGNIAKAQRFVPAVRYLGPFYLKPGQKATHKFKLTNYIGSVRAMVVCRNGNAFGKTSHTAKVAKPLMIQGNAPRVFTPGDEVQIPLTVFANEKAKMPIKISVANSKFLTLSSNNFTIDKVTNGEAVLFVKATVKEQVGIAKLSFTASCPNDNHKQTMEVPIRLPGYEVDEVFDAAIEPGKKVEHSFKKIGWDGTNYAVVEVSQYPSINLQRRLKFLIQYPHGCIEQTTSAAFPQLFVGQLMDVNGRQQREIDKNMETAIKRISRFQTMSGGFSYWPGGSYTSDWGTSYAGHFLLEAKQKGYYVSDALLKKWYRYQLDKINGYDNPQRYSWREQQQAYRLYTLALYDEAPIGAMNRFKATNPKNNVAKYRLASAYAIAGQKNVAQQIVDGISHIVPTYRDDYYTFGSNLRDKAIILESTSYLDKKVDLPKQMKELATELGSRRWMSTQETAYCLMAFAKVVGTSQNKTARFSITKNGKSNPHQLTDMLMQDKMDKLNDENKVSITNNGNQILFVRIINTGTPTTTELTNRNDGIRVTASYSDADGKAVESTKLEFGKDYQLTLKVKNLDNKDKINNIALSSFYPAGTELQIDRLAGIETSSDIDYEDIRDDKVHTYFSLKPLGYKEFKYTFTASFKGKYLRPGVYCEAMYDASKSSLIKGDYITVE